MIYDISLILVGIYIGQEYDLPKIDTLIKQTIELINHYKKD